MCALSRSLVAMGWLILLLGCTRVVVKKDPGYHDHGFRFNRPKPYLFIGPAEPEAKKGDTSSGTKADMNPLSGSGNGDGRGSEEQQQVRVDGQIKVTGALNVNQEAPKPQAQSLFTRVVIEIKYLPDYNEEYSVKLRSGIGEGKLEFKLEDGWNLTSVGIQTDQKLPELISSIASLLSAAKPGGRAAPSPSPKTTADVLPNRPEMSFLVDTRRDVPLGFYEPIVAVDDHGRKTLFGWRYVGFLPFAGCPVTPCVHNKQVECDPSEIWGLIVADGSLRFDTLDHISRGVTHVYTKPPYQLYNTEGVEYGPAMFRQAAPDGKGPPMLSPSLAPVFPTPKIPCGVQNPQS